MGAGNDLDWLMGWYLAQCDENWEHRFGLSIATLDNPGWSLAVDLEGTGMEGRHFAPVGDNVDPAGHPAGTVWLVCRLEEGQFQAFGGPLDLGRMIRAFRDWVEAS
jgi:hypothetical protein